MFLLQYPLDQLRKESFNALCVAILKNTISPHVLQVSAAGKDGGRDAVLDGACTTGKYVGYNYWIFQFKHHQGDLASSRSQALREFRKEAKETLDRNSQCDVYIFLTSVPFSGTPSTGLFDQVASACAEINRISGRHVEFWDGLKLCSFIDEFPSRYATFLGGDSPIVIPRFLGAAHGMLSIVPLAKIDSIDLAGTPPSPSVLEWLFPAQGTMLGPDGRSPTWEVMASGQFRKLQRVTHGLIAALPVPHSAMDYTNPSQRARLWSEILLAHSHIQLGTVDIGVRLLRQLRSIVRLDQAPEIGAWVYNLLSVAEGKLGRETRAQHFGTVAIALARRSGLHWLASYVQLRLLHRESWNAWEGGGRFDHAIFENSLRSSLLDSRYAGVAERHHLETMKHAFQGLHYSWDVQTQALATSNCQAALVLLTSQFDRDEAARMVSELGRMQASEPRELLLGIRNLKEAAQLRSQTGSLARLRYDLSWLASAYLQVQDAPAAAICARAALSLHSRLYHRKPTDSALIHRLGDVVKSALPPDQRGPLTVPSANQLDMLAIASGIDPIWWETMLV